MGFDGINNSLRLRSIRREYISVRLFNTCVAYANVILIIMRTVYKYKLDEGYSSRTLHNARLFILFFLKRSVLSGDTLTFWPDPGFLTG